jgi:hypothetical protein
MPFLGTTGGGSVKQYGGQANLGYFIKNSLRFRAANTSNLSRTPSAGTRTTWTWSTWVKRGTLSVYKSLFTTNDAVDNSTELYFNTDDTIKFREYSSAYGGYTAELYTTQVFRDPSAWYHIVFVWDSNNGTSGDRVRLYINGTRVTAFSTASYPSSARQTFFNSAYLTYIGSNNSSSTFDGYQAEVNFVDGQALTPSSFGKTDAVTGQWIPKKFAGTYGTNGFYLKFADASAATAAAIGKDSSPNGNNWTPNNISVTAGVTYDAMIDSPSLSGAASNYCVMNPLNSYSSITVNNANLQLTLTEAAYRKSVATMAFPTTGKYYVEANLTDYNILKQNRKNTLNLALSDKNGKIMFTVSSHVGNSSCEYSEEHLEELKKYNTLNK